jgi:hypothetical protein
MKTAKLLATATKNHQEASVACYLANLSPAEKAQRDEDMRRMQEHYSSVFQGDFGQLAGTGDSGISE